MAKGKKKVFPFSGIYEKVYLLGRKIFTNILWKTLYGSPAIHMKQWVFTKRKDIKLKVIMVAPKD